MAPDIEATVMRKVAWRLVPFLSLAYMINALDRFNVSIAALTMNKELGLSATTYGLAAGAFFWSYVLFQLPASVILTRVGARRWLGVTMIVWGACSAGTAFVTDATSFVAMRFLLGIAESGFFPGVAWFMTRWFPSRHRGRAMGIFYAFGASASVIGGPVSGNILLLHGWHGLSGWQWVFLLEGIPACLLAVLCPILMRDRPEDAAWLDRNEQAWLRRSLDAESSQFSSQTLGLIRALASPMIITLIGGYLLISFGVYAKNFFLPLMIKTMGYSDQTVGYLSALPSLAGVVGMIVFSRSSDRTGERVWHVALPCLLASAGLLGAGLTLALNPVLAMACFCLAGFGISASLPTFWNLPTAWLGPAAAAGGIAVINSIGNISGYVAPQLVGVLRDATGSYEIPMVVASLSMLAAAVCILLSPRAAARPVLAGTSGARTSGAGTQGARTQGARTQGARTTARR
jgi:ACS family tartrate transporter-like MFS transporter